MMHRRDFLKQYMLAVGSAAMVPVPGRTAPVTGNNAVHLREGADSEVAIYNRALSSREIQRLYGATQEK